MINTPVRYTPDCEQPEKDEQQVAADLVETMLGISKKTYEDSGHATRSVHVKSHGLLHGELEVLRDLSEALAQGMFAKAARYRVILRFSSTPGDMLPDSVSTPRGMAIKIIGVEGERLPGSEGAVTQDFILINGPAFLAPNAKKFLSSLKLLAATTNKMESVKVAVSTTMRATEKVIEAFGGESGTVKNMGGEPAHHPLGESYFTQVPLLMGKYIGKLSVVPVSEELTELTGKNVDISKSPTALRDVMVEHFATKGGVWEVRVQLCTNLETMPIEDASVQWPEKESPYLAVGRITVPPQIGWSEARSQAIEEGMSFSPWHGLAAHRPIGSVMRVRKLVYAMSAKFRAERNHTTMQEPIGIEGLFEDYNKAGL